MPSEVPWASLQAEGHEPSSRQRASRPRCCHGCSQHSHVSRLVACLGCPVFRLVMVAAFLPGSRLKPVQHNQTFVSRIVTRYNSCVIVSFRHKGLEGLYRDGSTKGVQGAHVDKLRRILSVLDVAASPDDLTIPSFRTHPLKGKLAGHWSIWVNGNWRVTFRFVEQDVELVDYQDYH